MDIRAASELAAYLPTVAVTPDSYRLVTDGADMRRRIIDRLLFHVEPTYLDHYQRYRRALRQRNAAIRGGAGDGELGGWDAELVAAGEQLTAHRVRYLDRALPSMKEVVARLVGMPVDIRFYRGWESDTSLGRACESLLTSDRLRGHTQAGPHRADLRFAIDGRPLQHSLSRGETKLFVTAVAVAQVRDLAAVLGYPPVVLVDDLGVGARLEEQAPVSGGIECYRRSAISDRGPRVRTGSCRYSGRTFVSRGTGTHPRSGIIGPFPHTGCLMWLPTPTTLRISRS